MMNIKNNIIAMLAFLAMITPGLTSCSDEPDAEHFYTFTGEMASDYLRNRSEYSEFTKIVERANQGANLMDMLSSYGHYTVFVPSNEAVKTYLEEHGLKSVGDLSDADCDTIARTHMVSNMYSTIEMTGKTINTANMNGRYLGTSAGLDDQGRSVIFIEGLARIDFELKDDSVENGIMQPIDRVLEKSNSTVADILESNELVSMFRNALVATGVSKDIAKVKDDDYDSKAYTKYYYTSDFWNEVAWVPDEKKYGYTIFVEKNDVLKAKIAEYGIDASQSELKQLYDLACKIYDPVYPNDVNAAGHAFENLTDSVNPLKRFVQYHIMTRYVPSVDNLTQLIHKTTNEAFGIETTLANPVEWFHTMLPHTMVKIEQLTMGNDKQGVDHKGKGETGQRYVNRRYDAEWQFEGAKVDDTVESTPVHDAVNGHYFYVDDLVVFSEPVRDKVQNMRIRMDFSTVFPEVMTNDMRYVGNYAQDDDSGSPDDATVPKNGRNFYFPEGYLDGVTFSNCHVVLRRPHQNFWSWQGDEWNLFGDYDFQFRLPPVPVSGDYQIRLGFCGLKTRGVAQVYFDGVPQGIPVDMTQYLNEEAFIGDRFTNDETAADYDAMSDEDKAAEQKLLKNLGAYRAPRSTYHTNGSTKYYFVGNYRTFRRVLCQVYIDATKDHYLRFRVASDGKQGNNNEFMLDYLEIVPKSVYGVSGEGAMEDDL